MPVFSFERLPARLRPGSSVLSVTTMPVGEKAIPTRVTEMKLLVHVDPTKHLKKLENVFYGCKEYADWVAGDEDRPGKIEKYKGKLGEMTMDLYYKGADVDREVHIHLPVVIVKSRPEMDTRKKGECNLVVRVAAKLTDEQLVTVLPLTGADISVSFKQAQMDISEDTTVSDGSVAEKKTRGGKARKDKGDDPILGTPN